jgi:heme exporter protein D
MNWESPAAFFAMGGDAFFVWGSYAVALACMVGEPLLAARRRRRALREAAAAARNQTAGARLEDPEEE